MFEDLVIDIYEHHSNHEEENSSRNSYYAGQPKTNRKKLSYFEPYFDQYEIIEEEGMVVNSPEKNGLHEKGNKGWENFRDNSTFLGVMFSIIGMFRLELSVLASSLCGF